MENLDFENLADVPMIDEVQDTDTVLVVRDGEVFRADGGNLGGGSYLVDVAADEFIVNGAAILVKTPAPGLLDALKKGANLIIKLDLGILLDEGKIGYPAYLTAEGGFMDAADFVIFMGVVDGAELSEEEIAEVRELYKGTVITACIIQDELYAIVMANGSTAFEDVASVATLSLDGEQTENETPLSKLRAAMAKAKEKLNGKFGGSL